MIDNTHETRLRDVIVSPSTSIGDAIERLDRAGTGALAVCSDEGKLVGILTDGDVRRAVLSSRSLEEPCSSICTLEPIAAREPVAAADALRIMERHDINQLPVLDSDGVLRDFILRNDLSATVEDVTKAHDRLSSVSISPDASIADAIAHLDKAGSGVLVLCTTDRTLCGLITDGDIRRAILQRKPLSAACLIIANRTPVVAPPSITKMNALQLMNEHDIHQLPIVDTEGCIVELLLRRDLAHDGDTDLSAVVMAGGYGKRLLPLTANVPKPMLPVGNRPLLELTLEQLRRSGIHDVNITTHYLPDSIVKHFGAGESFGVRLSYVQEDHPMGTAGGLKRMKRPDGPFLVINGDILTGVPFKEMLLYHRKHKAVMTVGVRKYEVQVPFGVLECDDIHVKEVQEKPALSFFINAGTYLLEPSACDFIPCDRPFDMTDLMQKLIEAGKPVVAFPIMEYWLDVGRHEDYQKAQEDVLKGRI